MSTLYGGIIFLREETPQWTKITIFAAILVVNVWFYALWARVMCEQFYRYRIIAKLGSCIEKISCYRRDSGEEEGSSRVQQPVLHPTTSVDLTTNIKNRGGPDGLEKPNVPVEENKEFEMRRKRSHNNKIKE